MRILFVHNDNLPFSYFNLAQECSIEDYSEYLKELGFPETYINNSIVITSDEPIDQNAPKLVKISVKNKSRIIRMYKGAMQIEKITLCVTCFNCSCFFNKYMVI